MQPEDRTPLFSVEADEVVEFTDLAESGPASSGPAKVVRRPGVIYTTVVDQVLEFTDTADNAHSPANGVAVPPAVAKPGPAA